MTQSRVRFLLLKFVAMFVMVTTIYTVSVPLLESYTVKRPRKLLPSVDFIVPNYVHFIRHGSKPLTFLEAICIIAALQNQMPEILFIHTDQKTFTEGKYWNVVKTHKSAHVIRLEPLPPLWDSTDNTTIAISGEKLHILEKYGGIFVDNGNYIVRSLDEFRKYEMTVLVDGRRKVYDHLIIATRKARFLREWLDIYKSEGSTHFFNKGAKLSEDLLKYHPHLTHTMINWMGQTQDVIEQVYLHNSRNWQAYYCIHLLVNQLDLVRKHLPRKVRKYPVVFNEKTIYRFNASIREMVADLFPRKFSSSTYRESYLSSVQ